MIIPKFPALPKFSMPFLNRQVLVGVLLGYVLAVFIPFIIFSYVMKPGDVVSMVASLRTGFNVLMAKVPFINKNIPANITNESTKESSGSVQVVKPEPLFKEGSDLSKDIDEVSTFGSLLKETNPESFIFNKYGNGFLLQSKTAKCLTSFISIKYIGTEEINNKNYLLGLFDTNTSEITAKSKVAFLLPRDKNNTPYVYLLSATSINANDYKDMKVTKTSYDDFIAKVVSSESISVLYNYGFRDKNSLYVKNVSCASKDLDDFSTALCESCVKITLLNMPEVIKTSESSSTSSSSSGSLPLLGLKTAGWESMNYQIPLTVVLSKND